MPPPCSICTHPERGAIDADLLAGKAIRIVQDRHGVSLGAINRHKVHIAHLVAASDARVAAVEQRAAKQYEGAQAEVGAVLADRAAARGEQALEAAVDLQDLIGRAKQYLAALPAAGPDPMQAMGYSKMVEATTKAFDSFIKALGGGAKQQDELRARLLGVLKNEVTIDVALKVIFEKDQLTPEAREALRTEANVYMLAGIDAALEELPADRRAAARDRALDAAKAAWARKREGGS